MTKKKLITSSCIAGLALCLVCAYTFTPITGVNEAEAEETPQKEITKEYPELLAHADGGENSKSETVYGVLDSSGNVKEVTVTEWIRNTAGRSEIEDLTYLTDISNVSGNEEFTQDGNELKWKADGSDITYTGTYDGQLPVSVSVKYYLDDEEVTPEEIAGKEGNIKIKFDYTINRQDDVHGETINEPYAMVSAVVLDSEHFNNVRIDNGKVVNDGTNSIAVGIALPGMGENLGIDDLDIPESVEISAYTDRFEIDGTYTVAASGFLEASDNDFTGDAKSMVDELEDGLDQLADASDRLVKGSRELSEGTSELDKSTAKIKNGAGTLKTGSEELAAGAEKLREDGTKELKKGSRKLNDNAADLAEGAKTVDDNAKDLAGGAGKLQKEGTEKVAESTAELAKGAKTLDEGLGTFAGVVTTVAGSVTQLDQGFAQYYAGLGNFTSDSAAGQKLTQVLEGSLALARQTGKDDLAAGIEALLDEDTGYLAQYDAVYANGAGIKDGLDQLNNSLTSKETKEQIAALTDGAGQLADGLDQLADGTKDLDDNAKELAGGASKLQKEGTGAVSEGAGRLQKEGTEELYKGAKELDKNTKKLADGAGTLESGAQTIAEAMKKLKQGTSKLDEGADQLSSGMKKFDKDGIDKFVSELSETDASAILDKLDAVMESARKPRLIGGKTGDMAGESKIIFKTDEIKAD